MASMNQSLVQGKFFEAQNKRKPKYVRHMDETLSSYTCKIQKHLHRENERQRMTESPL